MNNAFHKKLILQPNRNSINEADQSFRSKSMVGFEQPFKFNEWLVVKYNTFQSIGINSGFLQAILNGIYRKAIIMFFTRETFFLGSCNNFSILNERSSAVMIKCRDT